MHDHQQAETEPRPVWQRALLWTLWCVEAIAFVAFAGCSALLLAVDQAYPLLVVVALALILFIYAVKISLVRDSEGRQRPALGAALILIAGFIVFGGCAVVL